MEDVKKEIQMSESFRVASLLAVCGGILDAYSYLCRGGVFANAQTGNIVLVGMNAAHGNFRGGLSAAIPVAAFMLGILITESMRNKFKTEDAQLLHWRHLMLTLEIGLLALAAFIPIGKWNSAVNVIIAFVCAMQVQAFKKVRGHSYASTMCTGNLRRATEAMCAYKRTGDREARHRGLCTFGVILSFILGAVLGSLISSYFPKFTLIVAIAIYLIAFLIMTSRHK